jgi:hypothetical protein
MNEGLRNLWLYLTQGVLPPLAWCPFTDIAWVNFHFWGGLLIATAYLIFPFALWRIYRMWVKNERWAPIPIWVMAMTGLFVASCGIGHLLREWAMFSGHYRLEAAWMLVTGVISIIADLGLWLHGTDLKRHGGNNNLGQAS